MILVRPIGQCEWPAYRELRLQALRESPAAFGSTVEIERDRPESFWLSRLAEASGSGRDLPLFAVDAGLPCGLAWCKLDPGAPGVAQLFQMWVAPASRGRGAGQELVKAALAWAKDQGMHSMRLAATVGDTPAFRLYLRQGLVPVGAPEPLREGSTLLAQTLERRLNGVGGGVGGRVGREVGTDS